MDELESLYGFRWPIELLEVWALARELRPDAPRKAFDALGLTLVGPFDVLAGDASAPLLSMLLHWRFEGDPPELFTVIIGEVDHLHWGYWIDEGPADALPVVQAVPGEVELEMRGSSLRAALLGEIDQRLRDDALVPEVGRRAEWLALRDAISLLTERVAAKREDWDRHRHLTPTVDRMGVLAHSTQARREPVLGPDARPADHVSAAKRTTDAGKPGSTLVVARNAWTLDAQKFGRVASEIAVRAYDLMRRPLLARVARVHGGARRIPKVDVLSYTAAQVAELLDEGTLDEVALASVRQADQLPPILR